MESMVADKAPGARKESNNMNMAILTLFGPFRIPHPAHRTAPSR
jgi:hypothetical protein